MRETTVFFRDDDVGEFSEPLQRVMDLLLEAGVPCHYQVVPDYLDASSAPELRRIQARHPERVFFNQHGLHHSQEIDGERRHSEFDGGRPYEEQRRDIDQGRRMLEQALGDSFCGDIFTPPCHKYDASTLRALADLGFRTLSAGVRGDWPSQLYYAIGRRLRRVDFLGKRVSYHRALTPDPRLSEVSVSIDVHELQDETGRRVDRTVDDLWREFEFLRTRLASVGVMLHHQACDTPEKVSTLREFVGRLAKDPGVRFVTIPELAPGRRAA